MTLFTCPAPAKINLALHVTGQRADGYHLLDTLAVFADFGDLVSVRPNRDDHRIALSIDGPFAHDLTAGNDNLVIGAARAVIEKAGRKDGLMITLTKNLPIASGMGGGSADAAAAILATARALSFELQVEKAHQIALPLGADVPMCLYSQPLVAGETGTGTELLDPESSIVAELGKLHLLLVNPGVQLSTPEIFNSLKQKENSPLDVPADFPASAFVAWLKRQRNDLQEPAVKAAPIIHDVLQVLDEEKALLSRMSGSGATCFGLYFDAQSCEKARLNISEKHPHWWCISTKLKSFGTNRVQEKAKKHVTDR